MHEDDATRGVFVRIGKKLGRPVDSVQYRYGILSREKQGSENLLKRKPFTADEVSLCNAILLLALVRFVCILTPTSFSLLILQDAIILSMHKADATMGVFVRIGKKLGRTAASVGNRCRLLKSLIHPL